METKTLISECQQLLAEAKVALENSNTPDCEAALKKVSDLTNIELTLHEPTEKETAEAQSDA